MLDDPRPNDEIVFFYSGHGAQIPEYGEDNEPDRTTESLVPYDFDWTPEHAITDDRIYSLYSQLPYDTRLAMIFDCCHSGGIHRAGMPRPKGLNPPDDIRHREIKWLPDVGMWVDRDFKPLNKDFVAVGKGKDAAERAKKERELFFGSDGATSRLGRASPVRGMSAKRYSQMKEAKGNSRFGPYLPLILEACGEDESSYEYKHGVTSFGAFTFALSKILRTEKNITFDALVKRTGAELGGLKYAQTPQILGPARDRSRAGAVDDRNGASTGEATTPPQGQSIEARKRSEKTRQVEIEMSSGEDHGHSKSKAKETEGETTQEGTQAGAQNARRQTLAERDRSEIEGARAVRAAARQRSAEPRSDVPPTSDGCARRSR